MEEAQEPSLQKASRWPTIRRLAVFGLLVIIVAVAFWLWRRNQRPAEGRIRQSTSTQSTADPVIKYKTLDGKAISFQYLDNYQLRPPLKVDAASTEQYFLYVITPFSKHLAVAVEKLPGGNLSENGAFKLRQIYPDKYQIANLPVPNLSGKLAIGKVDGERVAFITKDDNLATLAFTSAGGSDNLDAEINQVLTSFKWK